MDTNQKPSTQNSNIRTYDRAGVFVSQDRQWVRVIHNGQQVGIYHRNFFLKLLDIPFEPKIKVQG